MKGRQCCPARPALGGRQSPALGQSPSRPIYGHGAAIYRRVALAQTDTHTVNHSLSGEETGPVAAGESRPEKGKSQRVFLFPQETGTPLR